MRYIFSTILICLLIISFTHQLVEAEDNNWISDPEVKDMKARVVDISWNALDRFDIRTEDGTNDTLISFDIELEIWNPYNQELVSYGSSSCRWNTHLKINADLDLQSDNSMTVENYGETCTDDLSPRRYPIGLSTEVSHPEILLINQSLLPDSNILVGGEGGTFTNKTDNFYGANMTIINGESSFIVEPVPSKWGEILYDKGGTIENPLSIKYVTILFSLIMVGMGRKFIRK
jgi:hypothetical protein